MELILLERIEKLGQMGDLVKVKPGFARNFLLPQGKALRATEENRKVFEAQRAQLETRNLGRKTEAESVAARMDGQWIVLVRQAGEAGQLYGSVNSRDVAQELTNQGFSVERRQVELDHPIKSIGIHPVHVRLHPEVMVEITVNVARSEEEAEIQQKTGRALIGEEEEEQAPEPQVEIFEEGAGENAGPAEDTAEEAPAEEAQEEPAPDEETEESSEPAEEEAPEEA